MGMGDPRQLPPRTKHTTLQRSIVERLWEGDLGVSRMEITTQYRCHPVIADIGSKLFYNDCLRTGVTVADRASCLGAGVPPVVVILSSGSEARGAATRHGSYEHTDEATLA